MTKLIIKLIVALLFLSPVLSEAQLLNELSTRTITLDNGEVIILFEEMKRGEKGKGTNKWYYLPSASLFTIPKTKNGKLDYSLFKYTSDGDASCNMIENQGGVFHCSVKWQPSPSQDQEIKRKLRKEAGASAQLKGVVTNLKGKSLKFLTVLEGGAITKDNNKLIGTSLPPTRPGSTIGLQKILTVQDAELIEEELLSGRPSLDFEIIYSYTSQVPVGDVKIKFDWSKSQIQTEKIEQEYLSWITTRWSKSVNLQVQFPRVKDLKNPVKAICSIFRGSKGGVKRIEENNFSYEELKVFNEFLKEKGVLDIQYDEFNFDDSKGEELKKKMRDAVFKSMISKMTIPTTPATPSRNSKSATNNTDKDDPNKVYAKNLKSYKIDKQYQSEFTEEKSFEINISASIGIVSEHPIQISVGTMLAECKECIHKFNLCDPFYQRIQVSALPNGKTKGMLRDEVLNYIAVVVKKKRPEGDFFSSKTISYNSLNKQDGLAEDFMFSYARPEGDPRFHEYEYEVEFTSGSSAQKHKYSGTGSKPAFHINIPLFPVLVELNSAASEKMKSLDIVKASAVVVYNQFGKKRYKTLDMNFLKGDDSVEDVFYMDEDATDFKYYITFRDRSGREFASREYTENKSQIDFESDPSARQKKEIYIYDELDSMELLKTNNEGKETIDVDNLEEYIKKARDLFSILKKL